MLSSLWIVKISWKNGNHFWKNRFLHTIHFMKKITQIILIISLFLTSITLVSAEESSIQKNTTVGSPLFITNPFRDAPKVVNPSTRKIFVRKPFHVLDNYTVVATGSAITLYKHNSSEVYIEKIDLSKWAHLESIWQATEWDSVTWEPLFPKMSVQDVLSSISQTPFSLINGQFFDPTKNPTPLSFGLKINWEIKTAGADNGTTKKNIISIGDTSAQILPYSWENLRDATGKLVLVSFSTEQYHYHQEEIGRTYICLANPDNRNTSSTLIVLVAQSMNEVFAENELIRFGCTTQSITKLDSSGSSRLWYNGGSIYGNAHHGDPDGRRIPNMIGIFDSENWLSVWI